MRRFISQSLISLIILYPVALAQSSSQKPNNGESARAEAQQLLQQSYEIYKPDTPSAINASLEKAIKAQQLSIQNGYKEGEAFSAAWAGMLQAELGNRTKAIALLTTAVELFDQLGLKREKANQLSRLGYQLALSGQLETGLDTLRKSAAQYHEIGDRVGEARTLNTLGLVHQDAGNPAQALTFYKQALSVSHAVGDKKEEGLTQLSIGTAYRDQNNTTSALEYFHAALETFKASNDRSWQFHALANIGRVYEATNKLEEACTFYVQALDLVREVDGASKKTELGMLNRIAALYEKAGNATRAKEYLERFLALQRSPDWQATSGNVNRADKTEPPNSVVNATPELSKEEKLVIARKLLFEAIDFYKKGTEEGFKKALQRGPEAIQLFHEAGDKSGESFALHGMGYLLATMGENRKALDYFDQALRLRREIGDRRGEGDTLANLGNIYGDLGDTDKELICYEGSLAAYRAAGEKASQAVALGNIGSVIGMRGDQSSALHYYQQSLALYREIGEKSGEASALHNLGIAFDLLGNTTQALEYFQQALSIYRDLRKEKKDESQKDNPNYARLSEEERALEYFRLSLSLSSVVEDSEGEASVLSSMGSLSRRAGEKGKALDYYEQSLTSYRRMGNRGGIAGTLDSIGSVYSDWGEARKALEYAQQALSIYRDLGDKPGESLELNNIGILYGKLNQKEKALECYQESLLLAKQLKNKRGEAITLSNLMWLLNDLNRLSEGIFYGKQSVNLYQHLRSNIRSIDSTLQRSYLQSIEANYRFLADLLIKQGRLPEAQQVLDLLKDHEYFEFVRRDTKETGSVGSKASMTAEEAALEKRYGEIADRLTSLGAKRAELFNKVDRSDEDEKTLAQLDKDIADSNKVFQQFLSQLTAEFTRPKEVARLEQIEESEGLMDTLRRLGPGSVALYTLVTDDKYRIILVTADVRKSYEYPIKSSELNRKVLAFRDVLQTPSRDPRPLAQEMYNILVGNDLRRDLAQARAQTLMWSLDGVLRYLPIAALHDGHQYFVESYRNVVFTPASHSRLGNPVSQKWRGLGLGVSSPQDGFVGLSGVQEELRGIIRDEGSKTSNGVLPGKLILDSAFTEAALASELRRSYPVVHIASHFKFQPGNETQSFLLLGDGTHLTLAEIKSMGQLFSGVDLLTLSACNTALGDRMGDGKEVESFGVIAQKKGAGAVMASLWPVMDESTQLFMREFYRLHTTKPNTTKGDTLRDTQLALLRGEIRGGPVKNAVANSDRGNATVAGQPRYETDMRAPFAHPYFWAPFILIGNWK